MANKLIIFDFDGVLVETEHTTFKFYQKLLPKYGLKLDNKDFHLKAGRKSIDFFKDALKDKFNLDLVNELVTIKRQAFLADVKKYLTPVLPAFKLLADCQRHNLTMAIGSQNEYELIQKAIDVFDIRKYFSMTTALRDLKNKKPHPEVFLMITNKLGFKPQESIVIEDSPHGIEAAVTGGFKSIGVTTAFSSKALSDKQANLVVNSLSKLTAKFLITF